MYSYYADLLANGNENELHEKLLAKLSEGDSFIIPFLEYILYCEMADKHYKLSLWFINHPDLFPESQELLDECLKLSIRIWRTDASVKFLEAGADPNKELIEERNILDVCENRADHFYSLEKTDLDELVRLLRKKGALSFLEQKYKSKISQGDIFETVCTYDSWAKIALADISEMDKGDQEVWCAVVEHCHSKSKSPSFSWKKKLDKFVDIIGAGRFESTIIKWLLSSIKPRKTLIYGDLESSPYYLASDSIKESFDLWKLSDSSSFILKGFAWSLAHVNPYSAAKILPEVIQSMYQPHYLLGSRDMKLAGAIFEVFLSCPEGKERAEEIIVQTEYKPAIKKMKAILSKCA
ncbi:hypothetical protein ACMC9M_06160 [Pseudomonadota bacterium 24LQ007]